MTFDTTHQSLRKQRSWRIGLILIFIFVVALSVVGSLAYADWSWGILGFKPGLVGNVDEIFMKYFIIIVAMERAAAVWIGLDRNAQKRAWERRVNRIREYVKKPNPDSLQPVYEPTLTDLKQMYARESQIIDEINKNSLMGSAFLGIIDPYEKVDGKVPTYTAAQETALLKSYALVTKQIYEFKLTKYEEQSYKLVTRIVFVGGVILAFIGLSILGDILVTTTVTKDSQKISYRIVDILITGGLLGGGSKSFSIFLNTVNKMLNKAKDPQGESS